MWRALSGSDERAVAAGLALLAADGCVSALIAMRSPATGGGAGLAVAVALVVVTIAVAGVVAFRQCGRAWRPVVISPYSVAALTWLALFVLRPLELYFQPGEAALPLAQLGLRTGDLTRAVALGGLGCAAWCFGYCLVLARPRKAFARRTPPRSLRLSRRGTWIVLAIGTGLWLALFHREGGLSALRHAAISVRTNQRGSFYAFIGVWIVQGVALYAFAMRLRTGSRFAALAAAVGALLSVLAAVALQLRGLAAFAALAAMAVYVSLRPVSRRRLAVIAVGALVAILVLGFAQQVRQYTAQRSLSSSIRLAAHTPLAHMYASDLSTYDNLVAIRTLVPSSIEYLDGRTLAEIPAALVPRAVWAGKPYGVDVRAGSYLYPGTNVALAISVQGELYWNAGVPGIAVGGLVLGLLFGLLAAAGLRTTPGTAWFVIYVVAVPFTHAFLTRGLATMTENLVFALVGVAIAIVAMGGAQELAGVLRLRRGPRFLRPDTSPVS